MKRITIFALCIAVAVAFTFAGCRKTSETSTCTWSNTKSKFPSKQAYREYEKDKLICPVHNVSLTQDEKYNASCETAATMMHTVDRMLADDWCEKDIRKATDMFKQGRRFMETIENKKACDPKNGRVRLDFFIMSLCPYGVQYVNNILPELIRETGNTLDWEPHYILDKRGGSYASLHGPSEVQEDKVEICLYKNWGKNQWLQYMHCFQQTMSASKETGDAAVTSSSKVCLGKVGIDEGQMKMCLTTQIQALLEQEVADSRTFGVEGSPTAIYNCNKRVVGALPFSMLKPYLCELYPKNKPEACNL
jgi:hypothetical protein